MNYTVEIKETIDITPKMTPERRMMVQYVREHIDWAIQELAEALGKCKSEEQTKRVIDAIVELKDKRNNFDKALLTEEITDDMLLYYEDYASDIDFCTVGALITELEKK